MQAAGSHGAAAAARFVTCGTGRMALPAEPLPRRRDLEAQAESDKAKAEAAAIRAKTRSRKVLAGIQEVAAGQIERRRTQTPEEALKRQRQIVGRIRSLGGDVEIPPLDGKFDEDSDDQTKPKA